MPRLSKYTRFTLLLLASKWVGKYKKSQGKMGKIEACYSFL
jgi:hypothetical protein